MDVWSVACIIAELFTGTVLFPGRDHIHQLALVFERLGTPSAELTASIPSESVCVCDGDDGDDDDDDDDVCLRVMLLLTPHRAQARAYIQNFGYRQGHTLEELLPGVPPMGASM